MTMNRPWPLRTTPRRQRRNYANTLIIIYYVVAIHATVITTDSPMICDVCACAVPTVRNDSTARKTGPAWANCSQ